MLFPSHSHSTCTGFFSSELCFDTFQLTKGLVISFTFYQCFTLLAFDCSQCLFGNHMRTLSNRTRFTSKPFTLLACFSNEAISIHMSTWQVRVWRVMARISLFLFLIKRRFKLSFMLQITMQFLYLWVTQGDFLLSSWNKYKSTKTPGNHSLERHHITT